MASEIHRNLSTPEHRDYWKFVEETAAEVAKWPAWKRGEPMASEISREELEQTARLSGKRRDIALARCALAERDRADKAEAACAVLREAVEKLSGCMEDRIYIYANGEQWSDFEPDQDSGPYETIDFKALLASPDLGAKYRELLRLARDIVPDLAYLQQVATVVNFVAAVRALDSSGEADHA